MLRVENEGNAAEGGGGIATGGSDGRRRQGDEQTSKRGVGGEWGINMDLLDDMDKKLLKSLLNEEWRGKTRGLTRPEDKGNCETGDKKRGNSPVNETKTRGGKSRRVEAQSGKQDSRFDRSMRVLEWLDADVGTRLARHYEQAGVWRQHGNIGISPRQEPPRQQQAQQQPQQQQQPQPARRQPLRLTRSHVILDSDLWHGYVKDSEDDSSSDDEAEKAVENSDEEFYNDEDADDDDLVLALRKWQEEKLLQQETIEDLSMQDYVTSSEEDDENEDESDSEDELVLALRSWQEEQKRQQQLQQQHQERRPSLAQQPPALTPVIEDKVSSPNKDAFSYFYQEPEYVVYQYNKQRHQNHQQSPTIPPYWWGDISSVREGPSSPPVLVRRHSKTQKSGKVFGSQRRASRNNAARGNNPATSLLSTNAGANTESYYCDTAQGLLSPFTTGGVTTSPASGTLSSSTSPQLLSPSSLTSPFKIDGSSWTRANKGPSPTPLDLSSLNGSRELREGSVASGSDTSLSKTLSGSAIRGCDEGGVNRGGGGGSGTISHPALISKTPGGGLGVLTSWLGSAPGQKQNQAFNGNVEVVSDVRQCDGGSETEKDHRTISKAYSAVSQDSGIEKSPGNISPAPKSAGIDKIGEFFRKFGNKLSPPVGSTSTSAPKTPPSTPTTPGRQLHQQQQQQPLQHQSQQRLQQQQKIGSHSPAKLSSSSPALPSSPLFKTSSPSPITGFVAHHALCTARSDPLAASPAPKRHTGTTWWGAHQTGSQGVSGQPSRAPLNPFSSDADTNCSGVTGGEGGRGDGAGSTGGLNTRFTTDSGGSVGHFFNSQNDRKGAQTSDTLTRSHSSAGDSKKACGGASGIGVATGGGSVSKVIVGGKDTQPFVVPQTYQPHHQYHHPGLAIKRSAGEINRKNWRHNEWSSSDSASLSAGRYFSRDNADNLKKSIDASDANCGDNETVSVVVSGNCGNNSHSYTGGVGIARGGQSQQFVRRSPVSDLEQKIHSDSVERDPQGKIRTFLSTSSGSGGGGAGVGGDDGVGGNGDYGNVCVKSMTDIKKKSSQREEFIISRCSERSSSTSSEEKGTLSVPNNDRGRRGSSGTCNHLFLEKTTGRKSPLPKKGRKSPSPVRGILLKGVVNSSSTSSSSSSADSSSKYHQQKAGKALNSLSPSSPPPYNQQGDKSFSSSKTSPKHHSSPSDSPTKKTITYEGPPPHYRGRRKFSDTGLSPVPRRLFNEGRRGSLTDERTLVSAKSKLGRLRHQGRKSSDASSVAALVKQIHNLWGDGDEEEEEDLQRRESGAGLTCSVDDQVLFDKRRKKFPFSVSKEKDGGGAGVSSGGDRKLITKISCTSGPAGNESPVISCIGGEGRGRTKANDKEPSAPSSLSSSSTPIGSSIIGTGDVGCQTPDKVYHTGQGDVATNEFLASSVSAGAAAGGVIGNCGGAVGGSEFVAPVAQVASRQLVATAVSSAACFVGPDTQETLVNRGAGTACVGNIGNTPLTHNSSTGSLNSNANNTKPGKRTATVQFQPIVSWDDNTVQEKCSPALRSVLKQGARRHSSFAGFSDAGENLPSSNHPPDNFTSVLNKQAKNGLPKSKTSDNYKSILKQTERPVLANIDSASPSLSTTEKKRAKSPSPKSRKNEKGFDYGQEGVVKTSDKSLSLCLKATRSLSPKSKKSRGENRDTQDTSTDQSCQVTPLSSTDRDHFTDSGNCSFDSCTKTVGVQATPRTIGKTSNTGTQTSDVASGSDSTTDHSSSPPDGGGWLQRLAAKCMASVGGSNRPGSAGGTGGGLPRAASVRAEWLLGNKRMGSSPSSPVASSADASEKFWVPHDVIARKRAQSLVPTLSKQESEDDLSSEACTPASIPHPRDLAFTFPNDKAGTSGGSSDGGQPSTPPAGYNPGRRRASMHDAIDLTKIDTRLYDKKLVRQASVTSIEEESQGTVHVSLEHNTETNILTVNLVRAHNLIPRDLNGTANPYCRLTLLPGQRTSAQSRIHRKTLNPDFEEEFIFELTSEEVEDTTLEVSFYEYDQFSKDECVGSVKIPLSGLDLSKQVDLWRSIAPYEKPKDQRDLGDVMFSLSYLPSAERLTVVIVKARNLRLQDDGKVDLNPFIKVCVTSGNKKLKKKKTSTAHGTNSPTWNEALVFSVHRENLKAIGLELSAYHDNKLGIDECIGRIRLSADSEDGVRFQELVRENSTPARWYCLS